MNMKKNFLKISGVVLTTIFLIAFVLCFLYIKVLPFMVNSTFIHKQITSILKQNFDMDLKIDNINLKTYLKPQIDLNIDNLYLTKENKELINLKDFSSSLQFGDILNKKIKLNHLLADTIIIDLDDLINAVSKIETKKQNTQALDIKLDLYNSKLELKKLIVSYKLNNTLIAINSNDISIVQKENYKVLNSKVKVEVNKGNKNYLKITLAAKDEIRIFDDNLQINNLKVLINKSDVLINSKVDLKNINVNVKSNNFNLVDIFNLINSDLIISNGEQLMAPLANPKGKIKFDLTLNNNEISGLINPNETQLEIKDITNLPIKVEAGKIVILKDKIDFQNLIGYWGKNKQNSIKIYGDIKDYYKTFDSNITIDTKINNEFFNDYLAKLINNTKLFVSKPAGTRIIYKAKNNIMDITWLAKIPKGVNFGVSNEKSALSDYDRAVKGDFNINGNNLNIKNINYYIAPDIRKGVKIEPIFVIDGKMDLAGNIDKLNFSFKKEMPCELLNVVLGPKTFRKGTIKGNIGVKFKDKKPQLLADMEINKTFVPSQRLAIKEARLFTDNNYINANLKGGFKRIKYDFKGKLLNKLEPPFVIDSLILELDNLDVERILASMNSANSNAQKDVKEEDVEKIAQADDNYFFDTNLIRINNANFKLNNGKYKDMTFSDIQALLTLDENGLLKIDSNRFNIADGISTLKLRCDLKKLQYYIRLGVKDVDSNLIAKTLLNLDKEINGKAKGLIELNGDESLKLNGDIKFEIKEGTIGKVGLIEYLLKVTSVFRNPIAMVSPATIMDIVSIPEGKFDKINGELKIKNNIVQKMDIKSYSDNLSSLIRGRIDLEKFDASIRIYTRFSNENKNIFNFLRNFSLNSLANRVQLNTRNDSNYYQSELKDLPSISIKDEKTQIFLTQVEGDVASFNFLSSLKKIK